MMPPSTMTHGFTRGGKCGQNYNRWKKMMQRCYSPRCPTYQRYGARGIQVCERWHDFENYNADIGTPPPGMTLDRINNDGNYEPGNCRWATPLEQSRNSRRSHLIEVDGAKDSIRGWARHFGVHQSKLSNLIRGGMPIMDAVHRLRPHQTRTSSLLAEGQS